MSDRESPLPAPIRDALVVRTPDGWKLTLSDRWEPLSVTGAAVRALVRASGGERLADDDPGRVELKALGVDFLDESTDTGLDSRGPARDHATWVTGGSAGAPAPESTVGQLEAFVARIAGGYLLIEAPDGKRYPLDEIDMYLVEALRPGCSVATVVARVRAAVGPTVPAEDELGRRLRRIADAGRLLLVESAPAFVPLEGAGSADDTQLPPAPSSLAEFVARWKLRIGRRRFPGRSVVARAYQIARRASHRGHHRRTLATSEVNAPLIEGPVGVMKEPELRAPQTGEVAGTAATGGEQGDFAWESDKTPDEITYLESPVVGPVVEGAIPVYSVFEVATGPALSLAMLTANARQHNRGALNRHFEIRRLEDPASFFADLQSRPGPAILLLSNYTWSLDHNMRVARRAREINPEVVIIHGGPSTPKNEGQCEDFFAEYGDLIDVAVRGEGEVTLSEALSVLVQGCPAIDLTLLSDVEGLSFRHPYDGSIVRTDDRERVADLDSLPSPYLTGEFDHLHPSAWGSDNRLIAVILESNRGCPYGCTFCDWGSSTLSRVRKFSLDRVEAEMAWVASRGHPAWVLADANFGIMSRDVEVADRLAAVKSRHGQPSSLGFNVAKNTTKHLTAIVDRLVSAGIVPHFTLALQTRDEATLEAVKRSNISSDHYVSLAATFRRRGLPLQADLMLCLPGQTVDSLTGDLQFLIEHEIPGRMWITQLLPNAPLNDPAYREEWAIQGDSRNLIISTSTFSAEDRREMLRVRAAYTIFERFGLLRHIGRMVQWDHGIDFMSIMRRLIDVSRDDPGRYPLLTWVLRYFDFFNVPPLGWRSFYDEVRRFLAVEFDIPLSSALDAVLQLQGFLMPEHGRRFPATVPLEHDYLTYFRENTHNLWLDGHSKPTGRPLGAYGPATFTVYADPLRRCTDGLRSYLDPRNETMTEDFWLSGHWELDSPLVRSYAEVAAEGSFIGLYEQMPTDLPDEVGQESSPTGVRLRLERTKEPRVGAHVSD